MSFGFLLLTLASGQPDCWDVRRRACAPFSILALARRCRRVLRLRALVQNDYVFFAGYIVLQFIVLATAWNMLGGYCGYVNFGSAAFFALGAYSSVALHKLGPTSTVISRNRWRGSLKPSCR